MKNRISEHIQIRFRDTDAMGHVNNAVYVTYFEMVRIKLFKEIFGLNSSDRMLSKAPVIAAMNSCNYRIPLFIGTKVKAECCVSKIGQKSFTIFTEIIGEEDGTIYADGETVIVFYDYDLKRSTDISQKYRTALQKLSCE
ncbi:MAG: thioesterase [bacterium]|nr:MAG: thioesterase [bacterium]